MDALVGPNVNQSQEPIHRNSGRTRELRDSIFYRPASTPLPGDGGYALLQEGVAWNLTYELACGFEVEFVGRFQERLSINAALNWTESEVTESNGPDLGAELPVTPGFQASVPTP